MIVVYPSYHVRHRPPHEIVNGNRDFHAETPERIESIKQSLEKIEGIHFILPRRFPLSWIEQVHDHEYINYLAAEGRHAGSPYVYPSVFPYSQGQKTENNIGQRGQFSFDLYTPINNITYAAAHGSAMTALTAASLIRRGERVSYALCRPPGHHAERARMGGYCYFNNAAIAANYLSKQGKVAILDVDFHHGNGTQNIFYHRSDVLVVNIHATPEEKFPYFSGWENEIGIGDGSGFNVNFPLPLGISDLVYHQVLASACRRIQEHHPDFLVVSLGFDTHKEDSVGGFKLTTDYFRKMGRKISDLHLPTLLIQEGGYNVKFLGLLATTFLGGFSK